MIACVTPTGDRPESLALSRVYFERAKALLPKQEVIWYVVDDGEVPFNPGGCAYLRRTPDGPNSLGRNLLHGFSNGVLDAEHILIWEDDDWYAPTRIINQVKQLNRWGLHGYGKSIYYNLALRGVFQHENFLHASLYETAMRREEAQKFKVLIEKNIDQPFLDLILWKFVKGRVDPHSGEAIGIKGGKGRGGLGCGHGRTLSYVPAALEDYIGGDSKNYEAEGKRLVTSGTIDVPEIGRKRTSNSQRLERNRNLSKLRLQR